MTYKHMKFKDSVVMKSLEKLAFEKGLVKPEVMKVEAAKKEVKSEFFAENLLLLCNKLRSQGFSKYASELEVKFLNLKQAEAKLYDVSGETGKDLIDFAHPKGGVKLDQDWDDLGTVETVSEQHEKILNVVHKPAKGKLEAKSAINAVKVVLSQLAGGATEEEQLNDLAQKDFQLAKNIWDKIDGIVRNEGKLSKLPFGRFLTFATTSKDIKAILSKSTPGQGDLKEVSEKINDVYGSISPGITGGVDENVWNIIAPMFTRFSKIFSQAAGYIARRDELRTSRELGDKEEKTKIAPSNNVITLDPVEQKSSALFLLFNRVEKLKKQLEAFKSVGSVIRNPAAMKWIQEELSDINDLDSRLNKVSDEQADMVAPLLEKEVVEEEAVVQEFINGWIKPGQPGV